MAAEQKKQPQYSPFAVIYEDALFRTEVGAMKFALNFSHGTTKKPSLVDMVGGGTKGRGLGGLDGAAQAAMIQMEMERIPLLYQAILVARHVVRYLPCTCRSKCCAGRYENHLWRAAIRCATKAVFEAGLTEPVSHFRFRQALVEKHFGARISFVDMQEQCHVSRNKASKLWGKVHEFLKDEEKRAHWAVEGFLKEGGVVE